MQPGGGADPAGIARRPGERPRFSARALQALAAYGWPGNVRELEHLLRRACLLATGPELDLELLPAELQARPAAAAEPEFPELTNEGLKTARDRAVAELEDRFVRQLMQRHGNNVSQAAREAGMYRSYLQKLLARHRAEA